MEPEQNASSANVRNTNTQDEALENSVTLVGGARPLLNQKERKVRSSAVKQNIVRQKIEQYFQRLTEGCQQKNCTNPNCASNPKQPKMSGNDAAIKAIELFQKKAEICKMVLGNSAKESSNQSSSSTNHVSTMDYKESNVASSSNEIAMETSEPKNATIFTATRAIPGHSNLQEYSSSPTSLVSEKITGRKVQLSSSEVGAPYSENSVVREVKEIKYLTEEMVIDLCNRCRQAEEMQSSESKSDEKQDTSNPYLPLIRKIREVFSDMENLNASFLRCDNGIKSPQKEDFENNLLLEESKMDVDSASGDTQSKQSSLLSSDLTDSSTATPFMSFWNSLLNEASDANTTSSASAESSRDEVSGTASFASESSNLHRSGAIKKKAQAGKANKPNFAILTPTVDVAAVRRVYKLLNGIECVERTLVKSLEDLSLNLNIQLNLLQQWKKGNSKDSKTLLNLNTFIIVMENDLLHSPEYLEIALPNFLKMMASLPLKAHVALAKLWSTFDAGRLQEMVQTFQQLLTFKILTMEPAISTRDYSDHLDLHRNDVVTSAVRCLKIVYYASLLGGKVDPEPPITKEKPMSTSRPGGLSNLMGYEDHEMDGLGSKNRWEDPLGENLGISITRCIEPLVPHEEFENEILNTRLDVYNDFIEFKIERKGTSEFTFMHYPFILNMVNKNTYLSYDNRIKMISDRRMMVLESILNGTALSPYLRLKIRRDHIIEDSLVRLELIAEDNPADLRKQLYVEFEGEQGVDEGGVSKEFFQLVVEQIFNPDYGMFTLDENTNLFWFNSHSFETKAQFTLIGIVLGLAIYNNCILDVKFPSLVYKKLYGRKADFEDMKSSHPILHKGLKELLLYEGNVEEDMMATFSVEYNDMFGIVHKHELKKDGIDIPVTKENRKEYVDLYADWLLNESIADQFGAFHRGFELVVSQSPLKHLFRAEELEVLISGSQEYDFKSLESTTDYDGGFDKNSPTIVDFWSVVHEMSDENKRKLLQFTTGTDRAPVGGLAQIKLVISRNGPDSDRLPTSHTCFNVILLPDYKNREKLKERLYKAVTYSKGFGML